MGIQAGNWPLQLILWKKDAGPRDWLMCWSIVIENPVTIQRSPSQLCYIWSRLNVRKAVARAGCPLRFMGNG